ncbi:MAG: hypothetical protein NC180_03175 [Muribaculaceae bacterium]|nr:hypothetical protein [Roseburia sp.]MCM1431306.1 hypothetical protein [Muribaculaceae bacterium]MCM1492208.1 hypothetical protein [Muribaculaceae bacterium]
MDKKNLVEELQKAFQGNETPKDADEVSDVEYKENTNTLLVNEQKTYENLDAPTKKAMSEEEIFDRLLKERRSK